MIYIVIYLAAISILAAAITVYENALSGGISGACAKTHCCWSPCLAVPWLCC
jgi:hypothetical protein